MSFARKRSVTVSSDIATNQTPWCSCKRGGMATIEVPGTMTANVNLQRRGADNVIVDATDNAGTAIVFTKAGTYTLNPSGVQGEYRLNCKLGQFTTGPFTLMVEGL